MFFDVHVVLLVSYLVNITELVFYLLLLLFIYFFICIEAMDKAVCSFFKILYTKKYRYLFYLLYIFYVYNYLNLHSEVSFFVCVFPQAAFISEIKIKSRWIHEFTRAQLIWQIYTA